jgi:hypothetical protein
MKTTRGCIKSKDLKSYSVRNNAISHETVPLSHQVITENNILYVAKYEYTI